MWLSCLCLKVLEHSWPIPELLCPAHTTHGVATAKCETATRQSLPMPRQPGFTLRSSWLHVRSGLLRCSSFVPSPKSPAPLCEKRWSCAKLTSCPGTKHLALSWHVALLFLLGFVWVCFFFFKDMSPPVSGVAAGFTCGFSLLPSPNPSCTVQHCLCVSFTYLQCVKATFLKTLCYWHDQSTGSCLLLHFQ